ncbi:MULTISPECIES: dihydropyrimidinase [unclassified Bradyrhizobium]|uniref:dihydropyrimidinase n=1 Tax=unclassified Bradyrhizobium TaxID=2631580 RepID=UPI002916CDB9|nr:MULTISPECIES: dihydropyrimidinase [unclassified Bradyrhizobium]
MTAFDTVIRHGTVVTASDIYQADVAIKDGRIAAIGEAITDAAEIVDASGLLVLPGGIDSHVHISQPSGPGIVMADDFESATRAAAFGGNTFVMPYCLQAKGQPLREALKDYHALADASCYIDHSFHLIVSDPSEAVLGQELPALVADGYTSLKIFMTYQDLALSDFEILGVLDVARETGALVQIHAENYDAIRFLTEKLERAGKIAPYFHGKSRPIAVEREATHRVISLAELIDVPIVIVHVSNREAMEEIRRAQMRGLKIFGETCPQYLVLTEEDMQGLNMEGAKYVCSPPPRDKESQQACWEGLQQGVFALFSSDHCPFRYDDEAGKLTPKGRTSFRWVPNGIPGVETRLPILFSEGVGKGRITLNQFVALTATNHAKTYGLKNKGSIAIGYDADIALWDPNKTAKISQAGLHHGSDYTPYEDIEITGWPVATLQRGKFVVRDGQLVGAKGEGRYLTRGKPGGVA